QVQLKAQQNIEIAQQKQKKKHDEHVKKISFHIGDKVLLYRSTQAKVHGDKFREKWKSPYYIHDVIAPG
ncbi:7690_t:CDS:1, partial [Dentiscutata erythropus]